MEQQQSQPFYGWFNLLFLFLIYGTVLGFVFYGFAVIFPVMIKAQGWGRGEAALAHTIRGFLVGFLAPLVALSIGRFGSRMTLRFGLTIGIIGLFMLVTVVDQLWHWIAIWGVVMPFAFAFGGSLPIQTTITFWFNIRRATALGIVLSGSALTGFVAAPFYTYIMEKTGTWRAGWTTAGIFCVLALFVSLFLKNKPQDIRQYPDGLNPESAVNDPTSKGLKSGKTYKTTETWTLKETLKTRTLYLYMICRISQTWTIYLLIVHGVLHLTDMGYSQMQAASVVGNLILFSGLARFPMGVIGDRIEPRLIITAAMLGLGFSLIGFWRTPENIAFLFCITGLFGFSFGAMTPLFPALIGNYFGPSAFAPINGFVLPVTIPLCAPIPYLAGLIYDRFHNYNIAFSAIITMVFIAAVCTLMIRPPSKKENRPLTC